MANKNEQGSGSTSSGSTSSGSTSSGSTSSGSTKGYLLRAIYQWAIDFQLTPQVLVDAGIDGVVVPLERVKNGRIVLTIHPRSVRGLDIGNEYLLFSARFAGAPFEVRIPVAAVLAIYGRENGQGIVFQANDNEAQHLPPPATTNPAKAPKKPKASPTSHLTLVK